MRFAGSSESGFTLMEVLVATVLLGIVSTASFAFAIQATQSSASQQSRDVATAVATEAMEQVNANISATDSATGVSYLFAGREESDVEDAWDEFADFPGVGETYPGWDDTADDDSDVRIPLEYSVERNGTSYDVVTLIGWCYKQSAASDCTVIPAVSEAPEEAPSGWENRLMRIIVIARWEAGSGCSDGECSFQTMTLIDATDDLEWNNG
jgi:prepilin-type N-terminal cleavage/methylation domain-containing protein